MLLENIKKFIKYFGKGQKVKLFSFAIMSFFAGCLEFIGVALIYPLILMIVQPENIYLSKYIKFENSIKSGLLIGLCVFFIFIFKNIFIIFTQYTQSSFVNNWKQSIIKKFMEYYIYAPYKDVMRTPPNEKFHVVNTLCTNVIDGFVFRILNLTTNAIIIFMVLLLLFIKFPLPAFVTCLFILIAITLQNKYFKKRISKISKVLVNQTKDYNNSILNILYNPKEIRIHSTEDVFFESFSEKSEKIKRTQCRYSFLSAIPPYIIEILIVSALIVMSYILSLQTHGNNNQLIASFAIFVAALFRIAPALNRIQSSIININISRNFVKTLNEEYEKCNMKYKHKYHQNTEPPIEFNKTISIENITFSYNDLKTVLKNISFEINKGDFIGIIGLSGSGKSTLADIITGILEPDSGKILVDGIELNEENFYRFRNKIGYIPQQINVTSTSVKENIAFGFKDIDDNKIIKSLKSACLYDVIMENPEGINASLNFGNNGLSYGQKQRLAIARALYRDPEILILDEATSSLDVKVEKEITDMLTEIGANKTIIAIAHRLSTLKACNKLIYMKDGKIVDIGSFSELSERYEEFDNLVRLSKIK